VPEGVWYVDGWFLEIDLALLWRGVECLSMLGIVWCESFLFLVVLLWGVCHLLLG